MSVKPILPTRVEIRRSPQRGRGIFACTDIAAGTLIERCPVLIVPASQVLDHHPPPVLSDYVFDWRDVAGDASVAIALGYGSLYNHDWPANAKWEPVAPDLLEIIAHRDIPAGREVTINYHGEPDDPEPARFIGRP
jgi:SET domain-containing protein